MDLQTRKLNLIQDFLQLQNESIISKLESLLRKENKKTESKTLLLDYNNELENANQRIECGSFYTNNEVENIVNQWK